MRNANLIVIMSPLKLSGFEFYLTTLYIYIRQVNVVNGGIYSDALISVRRSVTTESTQRKGVGGGVEVRLEPSTSRMGGERANHYTTETYGPTPFQDLKCTPSNEHVEREKNLFIFIILKDNKTNVKNDTMNYVYIKDGKLITCAVNLYIFVP